MSIAYKCDFCGTLYEKFDDKFYVTYAEKDRTFENVKGVTRDRSGAICLSLNCIRCRTSSGAKDPRNSDMCPACLVEACRTYISLLASRNLIVGQ